MIEWLLKEEEKAKVGRPKLAENEVLRRAYILLACSLIAVFVMSFCFISTLKGISPLDYAFSIIDNKLLASVSSKGFKITEKYKNNDFVMNIDISNSVDRYSGSYKYTLYELKKDNWVEKDSKEFDKGTKNFKVNIETKRNVNKTYKIKLQILNSSKISSSYAPFGWKFVDAENDSEKYAYKTFTVKGYYSSILNEEIKELEKNKEKINITTTEDEPRNFIVDALSFKYDISVSYTDQNNKKMTLKKETNKEGKTNFYIPNLNRITKVTFKIWIKDISYSDLKNYKLSNWKIKQDKDNNYYLITSYELKPEASYKL